MRRRRPSNDTPPRERARNRPVEDGPPPTPSPTAIAVEALRTGVLPLRQPRRGLPEIPREDETMRAGDPDEGGLCNEYVGDDIPGGCSPTPDQNSVDAIGKAYGLQEEDCGALRSAGEVLRRRDRRRIELTPPGRHKG